jgi:hypothetical protein
MTTTKTETNVDPNEVRIEPICSPQGALPPPKPQEHPLDAMIRRLLAEQAKDDSASSGFFGFRTSV